MSKFLVVLGVLLVALVGCQPAADKPLPPRDPELIDYSGWPEVTKGPIRIDPQLFNLCRHVTRAEMQQYGAEGRGPHTVPAVRVYANDVAATHLREDRGGSLPTGAAIVKEKWWNEKDNRPAAYAAMIKKEPGYDPEHGDWEYVYVSLGEKTTVERGRLESCRDCHAGAVAKDYLFRTYLKGAK
jgi:hypothetical protein